MHFCFLLADVEIREPFVEFGIIAASLLFVLLIVGLQWRSERKRRRDLKTVSRRIGFYYTQEPKEDLAASLNCFKLFQTGHSRKFYNILQGNWNSVEWLVFDYRYTVGGGRSSHTYNQTVAYVDIKSVEFPHFYLGPESFFHKIGESSNPNRRSRTLLACWASTRL